MLLGNKILLLRSSVLWLVGKTLIHLNWRHIILRLLLKLSIGVGLCIGVTSETKYITLALYISCLRPCKCGWQNRLVVHVRVILILCNIQWSRRIQILLILVMQGLLLLVGTHADNIWRSLSLYISSLSPTCRILLHSFLLLQIVLHWRLLKLLTLIHHDVVLLILLVLLKDE